MKPFKFKLFKWTIELSRLSDEEQVNNAVKQTFQEKSLAHRVDDYAINVLGATIQPATGYPGKIIRMCAYSKYASNIMVSKEVVEGLFEDNGKGAPRWIK